MPEKITGKDPYMISLDAVILFLGESRYFEIPKNIKIMATNLLNLVMKVLDLSHN